MTEARSGNFAVKIIIGFSVVIGILIVALLFTKELNYDSFDQINTFEAALTQSEEEYLVYFYSETCSHCAAIKSTVLAFADDNAADIKVYFANTSNLSGTNIINGLTGTPSVVHVVNGFVVAVESGSDGVPRYFDALELNAN